MRNILVSVLEFLERSGREQKICSNCGHVAGLHPNKAACESNVTGIFKCPCSAFVPYKNGIAAHWETDDKGQKHAVGIEAERLILADKVRCQIQQIDDLGTGNGSTNTLITKSQVKYAPAKE